MIEKQKIARMFDYLYNPTENLQRSNGTIVFGRGDPLVAKRAAEIYNGGLTGYLLFTGGIGKDSRILTEFQIPEAKWQAALANIVHGVPSGKIYVEPNATNGAECCNFSLDLIAERGLPHKDITLLIHPTSLRRIGALIKPKTRERGLNIRYQGAGTNYNFDPSNPGDQKEAVAEILRLADWPAKGWCESQEDLPEDLVEYARGINFNH